MSKCQSLILSMMVSVAGACGGSGDGGGDYLVFDGGSLYLEGCGYTVETRAESTAPELAEAVLGPDPTPKQIRLGLATDPATSMVVSWRTVDEDAETPTLATTVQYGTGGQLDRSADGFTHAYVSGANQNGEMVRIHETHLCDLEPDTEYSYRVGGADESGNEVWSDTYTFRTAPDPAAADAEVVLAVTGDSRDGYDIWGQMAAEMALHAPDVILYTGDAVTIGLVQEEWEAFFDSAAELLREVPMVAAHGNHEVNAVNFYSLFAMPDDEENFGLRYGPAHIVVLNDTPASSKDIEGHSAEVLEAEMSGAADAPWKLLMHHRSIWSASNHGGFGALLEHWGPIIDEHHVDMVLSGHDHNYERSRPMRGEEVVESPEEGTVYVVAGGAGAPLYGNGEDYWTAFSEKTFGFVILKVRANMLELTAYREDGTVLDAYTISK